MLAVASLVVALDQATKGAVRSARRARRADRPGRSASSSSTSRNSGIAFGLLGDASAGLVLAVTLAALALIVGWFATDPAPARASGSASACSSAARSAT